MTPTEKKLLLDRLEEFERIQEAHANRLADQETTITAMVETVAAMEERMSAFEPALAGINGKLDELLTEKREKALVAAAIEATPAAQFMTKLKAQLMNAVVLLISGFVVAFAIGIVVLLFKNGAFKALGWG